MAERQYAVWDEVGVDLISKTKEKREFCFQNNLSAPLVMEELDSSNGIIFPFYDQDTNVIFLCGKVRIDSSA